MEFKVGDKVRLTRKALHNKCASPTRNEVFGGEVNNIDKDGYYTVVGFEDDYLEQSLELVPEQSQFEYGEMVEVYSPNKKKRRKRFFICEAHGARYPYICVDLASEDSFKNGKKFQTNSWGRIRKLPHQLTRKEIANHFGVDENFILIDDINEDEI